MRLYCDHCENTVPAREHPNACSRCGRTMRFAPELIDEPTAAEFYQRIADAIQAERDNEHRDEPLPVATTTVRRPACERFFKLGWRQYGLDYLLRDNAAEAQDEGADGTNYCLMEFHRLFLEDLDEGDLDACRGLLLEAAMDFAKAHEKLARYTERLHEARSMVPK